MSNLFSVFDPSAFFNVHLNWMSSLIILAFLPGSVWVMTAFPLMFFKTTSSLIYSELATIFGPLSAPGLAFLPITLFLFIALNNFSGLFPYVFTSTSHLTATLGLALPLWAGHTLMGWVKSSQHMLAHLVPLGTPPLLMPFMVLIEVVSSLIRPITLSVRLAANMIAGHLLLALLSSQGPSCSWPMISCLIVSLILLGLLETAVALIQSFVFSVLSTLYFNEVNSPLLGYTF